MIFILSKRVWAFFIFATCFSLNTFLFGTKTIDDFSQLNRTIVSDICYPSTIEEIQQIVRRAKKEGKKISIAGIRHSQGGHAFCADAVVIDMRNFNKIIKLDTDKKIITVQPGATWEQIQEYINPHNLAINVMQTTQIFTVGGSLSVNAHGRDPKHGPLIETVKSITILLASGNLVHASRTENPELFSLAIGGYGLFGVIVQANIELTDNLIYKKNARIVNVKNYESYVKNNIIDNPHIGLHYGIICLAPYEPFRKMLVVNYTNVSQKQRVPAHARVLEQERFVKINKTGLDLRRQSYFFNLCSEFGEWPFIVMRETQAHTTCRNNAMRHPNKCLAHTATTNTDILQSYFIPTHAFVDFMNYVRSCRHENDLKIFYALTRYIPKNTESFLTYTTDNYFEIVLLINHGTKQEEIAHAQHWTQRLVDKVLSYGGKYYLPVRLYPSSQQLETAYPQIHEFFAKKRMYDPQELFINNFYKTYAHNEIIESTTPAHPLQNPEKVEFAFDMHDVLITNTKLGITKAVLKHGAAKIPSLIGRLGYSYCRYLFTGKVGRSQQLVTDLQTLGSGASGGSGYIEVLNSYEQGLGDVVTKIMREHYPIEGMTELVKELHDLGYTLRIATNEGAVLYEDQQKHHPELFGYFDGGKTVDYTAPQPWVKKPSIAYFEEYQARYNADKKKTVIFIDDNIKNVASAQQAGMIGIHFNNAQQLREQLIALGVPLKKT